ncbi:MAG: DNA-directed RNA polymerase subunit alpha C-terminal domain-containing protein [Planctomycetota bacterium]
MTATLDTIAAQIQQGRMESAKQALQAARKSDGNSPDVLFLEGYVQELAYDRSHAMVSYRKALEQDPNHTQAAFRAALLSDQAGEDEDAIEFYEHCTKGDRAPVRAMVNLAVLYEEQGMLQDAEDLLEDVLQEYPNHARARHFLKSVHSGYTMAYDERSQREREQRDAVMDMPITDFELSVRSRNCLRQMSIRTIGDLLMTSEPELLAYKNFGETSLGEVKAILAQKGLRLGQGLQATAPPAPAPAPTRGPTEPTLQMHRPVSELELSVRSRKCLQRLGIMSIGELVQRSESELMSIKNFGLTSLSEIKRQLAQFGFSLRKS